MKTILATMLALGLLAGQASALTVREARHERAAQELNSQRYDRGEYGQRLYYNGLPDSNSHSHFGTSRLSDDVFGTIESNAP